MEAQWQINDFDDQLNLQIELGNKHAVTLTIWKNGDPPSVALWCGSSEHSFIRQKPEPGKTFGDPGETFGGFKAWLDCAQGNPCAAIAVVEASHDPVRH